MNGTCSTPKPSRCRPRPLRLWLVWTADREWNSDNDPEDSVYVDGPALKSIQASVGLVAALPEV
jgi:hypothetical protein